MPFFVNGLDLGTLRDFTAHVCIEVSGTQRKFEFLGPESETRLPMTKNIFAEVMPLVALKVVGIHRYPLGSKYKEIAVHMEERIKRIPKPRYLAIDRTGVGVGVMENFEHMSPIGVTITGTGKAHYDGPLCWVPKIELMDLVQTYLQSGVLQISGNLKQYKLLTEELENFHYKISSKGHESFEAWRERDHDDLVLATAIAVWTSRVIMENNGQLVRQRIQNETRALAADTHRMSPV